jgi:hypothetical protein
VDFALKIMLVSKTVILTYFVPPFMNYDYTMHKVDKLLASNVQMFMTVLLFELFVHLDFRLFGVEEPHFGVDFGIFKITLKCCMMELSLSRILVILCLNN